MNAIPIKTILFDPHKNYKTPYMTRVRSRMSAWVYGHQKPPKQFIPEFGCTVFELRIHIEIQFSDGMRWTNAGQWQIDHIEPCAWFNEDNQEHVFQCNHWSNIRPIWSEFNSIGPIDKHSHRPEVDYQSLKNVNPISFWEAKVGQAGQGQVDKLKTIIRVGQAGHGQD